MSRTYKKNLVEKSGRWLKKNWYKLYRKHIKNAVKKDQDDINIEHPNVVVNPYNITDYTYSCKGDPFQCWCGKDFNKVYCPIKNK